MRDSRYFEQAADVLDFARTALDSRQRTALVVVTATIGGGVRAAGAIVAVTLDGQMCGYVSNGCVDADVVAQTQSAILEGKNRTLVYGQGSPFFDIILPCGGSIELLVFPLFESAPLQAACYILDQRKPVTLVFDTAQNKLTCQTGAAGQGWDDKLFFVGCVPRPRIRVAGQGASFMAVARLGIEMGFEIIAQSPNIEELAQLESAGANTIDHLSSPLSAPLCLDDQWTAVLLLFHDHDWEVALLLEELKNDAVFLGAMGSSKTHVTRIRALTNAGIGPHDIARVTGPLGLVPSLRDAKQIAISALAQVVACFAQSNAPKNSPEHSFPQGHMARNLAQP